MNELIAVLLSSITTLLAVYLKFFFDKKKDAKTKDFFWDLVQSSNIHKIEIKFKKIDQSSSFNSDFNYKSNASTDFHESFLHSNSVGINVFSKERLNSIENDIIMKYLNNIENKV